MLCIVWNCVHLCVCGFFCGLQLFQYIGHAQELDHTILFTSVATT